MLNRRFLRIKAMQGVFAFRKKEESNFNLAIERIDGDFAPDLNSMIPPDHQALARNKKDAKDLLKRYFNQKHLPSLPEFDEEVIDSAQSAINYYKDERLKDIKKIKQQLLEDTDNILNHYYNALLFLTELYNLDVNHNKTAFNTFETLQTIESDDTFQSEIVKRKLKWEKENSIARKTYKDDISKDERFIEFLKKPKKTIEDEKEILKTIVKKHIFKNPIINNQFDENDAQWEENAEIALSLVLKSIKKIELNQFVHYSLSENWEEDKDFLLVLFTETAQQNEELKEKIAASLSNWKLERVALTDQIILEMALIEMIHFPYIPTKVTINEFIELSKKYSTPKSKQFINGVLDVLAAQLVEDGTIKKSGRGLIDNR